MPTCGRSRPTWRSRSWAAPQVRVGSRPNPIPHPSPNSNPNPAVPTRFGRIDADSAADSVEGQPGRLPTERSAVHLRELFYAKGFNDREVVALTAYALVEDYGLAQVRARVRFRVRIS